MTTFVTDAPQIAPRALLARLLGVWPGRPAGGAHSAAADAAADAEDARARRAFVMDRLAENPDAFSSAYDVHAMMSLYPRSF